MTKQPLPLLLGVVLVIVVAVGLYLFAQPGDQPGLSRIIGSPTPTTNAQMLSPGTYEVQTAEPSYFDGVRGYYAAPAAEGVFPGVVMIHEWWGLNDNIKEMARLLASQGYQVLAVDLFNGSVAQTPEQARAQTSALDQAQATNNLKSAVMFLRERGAAKIASLGWCFGGGQSLQLSLADGVDATVIYYGQLVTDTGQLRSIDWPVLGIFGDQDQSIPVDQVRQFQTALNQNNTPNEISIYPGVGHAFANPSGANYAPEETRDAWQRTVAFLERNLR